MIYFPPKRKLRGLYLVTISQNNIIKEKGDMKLFDNSFESLIESLKEQPERWEYDGDYMFSNTVIPHSTMGQIIKIYVNSGWLFYKITYPEVLSLTIIQKIKLRPYVLHVKHMSNTTEIIKNNIAFNKCLINIKTNGESND